MVSGLAERLLRGNASRRTRLHDEKGNRLPVAALAALPHAALTCVARVLFGWRPERPTLSYRAVRRIAAHLTPDSVAVEFGSGMSTLWLAPRVGRLLSVEADPGWADRVRARLAARGHAHVRHELRPLDTYARLDDLADETVDFALIDGHDRAGCARAILPKMRAGGMIYLDNSDKDATDPDGDTRRAERHLLEAAAARGWRVTYFTDLVPTNLFVEQGMMVELEPSPR